MVALVLLGSPVGAAGGWSVNPGSGILGNLNGGGTLLLPKGVHPSSLGTLWRDGGQGKVSHATINTTLDVITFSVGTQRYAAQYVDSTSGALSTTLLHDGVNVTISTAGTLGVSTVAGSSPTGGGTSWWIAPVTLVGVLGIIFMIMRRGKSKRSLWGKNRFWGRKKVKAGGSVQRMGSTDVEDVPTATFADVAGVDEAVADMREIVEFLRDPEKFARVGAVAPKGALMVGPPGTGKTLLARAVAGEAGVPFFSATGSDFAEMYVGVGPKRVRELFGRARKAKGGAIVFIDEIDAMARRRSSGQHVASESEHDNTLIALLSEMDGFSKSGVIVLAATNRPDILDPAITRPGRLDRRVEVPVPDRRGRETILGVHSKNRPLADDVDLDIVARRTAGMSGADLANIVNEASIAAAREDDTQIRMVNFDTAILTVMMGRARQSAVVTEHDRLVTAWHEAGHTVCAYLQESADQPISVSIIPRGVAGGVTAMGEDDNNFLQRSKAAAQLVVALGGRAAEQLLLGGDFTQGAYGDLMTATNLASSMATHYGMTDMGLMVRDALHHGPGVIEGVPEVVEELLSRALGEATRILRESLSFVQGVVAGLLDADTLSHTDLATIYTKCGQVAKVGAQVTLRALYGEGAGERGEVVGAWESLGH
jgi:cell division protease FtsH